MLLKIANGDNKFTGSSIFAVNHNMRILFTTAVAIFFSTTLIAQAPLSWSSADMYLALRKLNVLGSVLYLAAHPDDENTRLLAWLSKEKLYRTGYLSVTRGDGGQNLIGDEQGVELGLIRTQELLSARRIDGAEQFFTRAFDFGFSKSPEETFTKWDKEKILSDVVWIIRKFQPDVIITRFPTTGEGGHGHHTASAILANEAFTAAADPGRFPEQLKWVKPWQVKRVLWNTFNFGGTNTTSNDQFRIDVGGYNPLLGKGYGEIAAQSRSQHKSQGFGIAAGRGEAIEYFKATSGTTPSNDLLEDVDATWKRVTGGEKIAKIIDSLSTSFDFLHPEKSVRGLVRLYRELNGMPDGYWKSQKLKEVQQLIGQCSGLWIDVYTGEQFAVQTDSIRINFSFNNRLGVDASLKKISIDSFDSTLNQTLSKNRNVNFGKMFYVPASKPITQPYWLENKMEEGYYNVNDQQKIGQPDIDPAYVANVTLNIEGEEFSFTPSVKYKYTDPVKGEVYWPLSVTPSYSLKINPELYVLNGVPKVQYEMIFSSYKNNNFIRAYRAPGVGKIDSFILRKNEIRTIPFSEELGYNAVRDPKNPNRTMGFNGELKYDYTFKNELTNQRLYQLNTIRYDHIPTITYFKDARVILENFDFKIVGKRIGYIVGAGDRVPEALEQMGYSVTLLTNKELSRNNLQQFDAIITGVRAYNTNDWMNNYYDKLMKYVKDGGNLIVQYNTSNQSGSGKAKIGPYDFTISRIRVTDENAPVTFLKPTHSVLSFPNKITKEDFKGWIQERSTYHATDLDKNYETIFSMNDPGERPDEGSLVIARYGKGTFVYTGLVFFRELPAGVPGAYRLMANLIALNKQKAF
jgi:LmbE family N-acetylglucosaminyl deacetylase